MYSSFYFTFTFPTSAYWAAETAESSCFWNTATSGSSSTLPHSQGWGDGGSGIEGNLHCLKSTRSSRPGWETSGETVPEHALQKTLRVDQRWKKVKMEATNQPPNSTRIHMPPFKDIRLDSFLLSIQKY